MLTTFTERLTQEPLELHFHYWIAFLDFPYFERVWPLQETAVASRPLLICGNATLSFHAAKLALLFMTPYFKVIFRVRESRILERFNGYEIHRELAKVFQISKHDVWKRPQDVYQLRGILFLIRGLKSTVVSDKLFSLYTILKDFCPEFPEPQEDILPTDLWPRATLAIINSMHCLDLIMNVHDEIGGILPSWSFDWARCENSSTSWDAPDEVLTRCTPAGAAWDKAPILEWSSGPGPSKRFRIKGERYSTIKKRSLDQKAARDWYIDYGNDADLNDDLFRENRPEFATASQQVVRMLFDWVIPKLGSSITTDCNPQTLCRELLLWDTGPMDMHYQYLKEWYIELQKLQYLHEDGVSNLPDTSAEAQEKLKVVGERVKFHSMMCMKRLWRCFFRTEDGRIGDGFHTVREGDLVVLLCWAKVPAILRPTVEDPSLYTLVCFVYIQGLVDCHAWDLKEDQLQEFTLV
jgi:hypothetical protein